MALSIYNTLTRRKEPFEPVHEGRVNIYVCGPTVYDSPHIGHAKSYVSYDIVLQRVQIGFDRQFLEHLSDALGFAPCLPNASRILIRHGERDSRLESCDAVVAEHVRSELAAGEALREEHVGRQHERCAEEVHAGR